MGGACGGERQGKVRSVTAPRAFSVRRSVPPNQKRRPAAFGVWQETAAHAQLERERGNLRPSAVRCGGAQGRWAGDPSVGGGGVRDHGSSSSRSFVRGAAHAGCLGNGILVYVAGACMLVANIGGRRTRECEGYVSLVNGILVY